MFYALLFFTISSCKKDANTNIESFEIKDKTIDWIISKKVNAPSLQSATFDSVINNLNWDLAYIDKINDSIATAYIPIHSNEDKRLTILYNTKQKSIDSGNLVLIKTPYNKKAIEII